VLVGHSMSDADGHILALDQGVCEILQRSEAEIIGMSYTDLTHPDDRIWNVAQVDALENRSAPITIRKRYLRPAAPAVWCDVQVSRLAQGTDRGRLIGTLRQLNPADVRQSPEQLWRSARRMNAVIQSRRIELGNDLFADVPWVILLQLYLTEAEGRCAALNELAVRSASRPESVSRWLRAMGERKLVDVLDDPACVAQLTALGIAKIEKLLGGTQAD
jgi:hypothetical protein